MANPTFKLINSVTVGSGGQAAIDFTSIPSTYTDLVLKLSLRGANANIFSGTQIQFNGDTGSNYTYKAIQGDGGSASSFGNTTTSMFVGNANGASATTSTFANIEIYIPNYAGSNQKSVSSDCVDENNATTAYSNLVADIWTGTSAITSIKVFSAQAANWVEFSTATLYGVKNS